MTTQKKKRGKRFLLLVIMALFLITLCLFGSMAASIPARTAQGFGQPDPNLPITQLYRQSLILLFAGDDLSTAGFFNGQGVSFTVLPGDSLDRIISSLVEYGLVQNQEAFRAYLIYTGIDRRIQPGEYFFSSAQTEIELAQTLGNPPSQTTLAILAGWRAEEISEKLSAAGLEMDPGSFIQTVLMNGREGYLFPGIYTVERNISSEALVEVLYQRFLAQITPELESQFAAQGLSLPEAVILASIIEREAVIEEEMPLIASVFLNRLNHGMNLAADPTIQYALGFNRDQGTWWTNPLSLDDLKLPSSYNTYENPGLPPGPICNPSLAALQAAAYPAQTSYFYFRADCDGSGRHLFAEDFQEHLNNACP